MKLKKVLVGLSIGLCLLVAISVVPLLGSARNSNSSAADRVVVGYISDAMCGLKHMSGMGDDKSCTLACVKQGSKFVLGDRDHKRVYQLDGTGQERAREFAGQKVKVTGTLNGRTLKVSAIEVAS